MTAYLFATSVSELHPRTDDVDAVIAIARHRDRRVAIVQPRILRHQPHPAGRRPDDRRHIALLRAAGDPGIVEVEIIVARIDLHRADAPVAERLFRLDRAELPAL